MPRRTISKQVYLFLDPSIENFFKFEAPDQSQWYAAFRSFGFDSSSNDYKVVTIAKERPTQVQIYSLNAKAWKSIDVSLESLFSTLTFWCDQVVLNGVVY